MAVVLGNFEKSKQLKELSENLAYQNKLDKLRKLIEIAQPQVEKAKDLFDTYRYIAEVDDNFKEKLWSLLCKKDIADIHINSYFAWGVFKSGLIHKQGFNSVYISRFGISFMDYKVNEQLQRKYQLDIKDIYRGKVLLKTYLNDFHPTEKELDQYIEDLEIIILHFDKYAERFFNCVSNYKVN